MNDPRLEPREPAAHAGHGAAEAILPGQAGRLSGWVLALVTATVLFTMMVITFIDVVGRKFFNSPLYGGYEITEFLMGSLIFSALPIVTAREGHVTIDVLDYFVPTRWRQWQQTIVTALSAIVLAYIAWRLWVLSSDLTRNHEVTMTLHIPHGPFARVFAGLAALASLACLINCWDYLRGRRMVGTGPPADSAG